MERRREKGGISEYSQLPSGTGRKGYEIRTEVLFHELVVVFLDQGGFPGRYDMLHQGALYRCYMPRDVEAVFREGFGVVFPEARRHKTDAVERSHEQAKKGGDVGDGGLKAGYHIFYLSCCFKVFGGHSGRRWWHLEGRAHAPKEWLGFIRMEPRIHENFIRGYPFNSHALVTLSSSTSLW